MELRQRSCFAAVTEELHLGRAEAKVHIAQLAPSNGHDDLIDIARSLARPGR